ncbi:MAG: hypothetical protein GX811_03595 [Lentisphaerae bacterium]|nr:hypothetical protein [Lentisphaerota bacterium]
MVKGLDLFRDRFKEFADRYILIGGVACDLIFEAAGLNFRATKDLDIVLCLETLDTAFGRAFWEFVNAGGYQIRESEEGRRRFYRFRKPSNTVYPEMLELFSRSPDILAIAEGSHLTPSPISDEISSLSAILLEKDYYDWIQAGRQMIEGVPIVGQTHLIPLKATAWLDLRARREAGEKVDAYSIKKHKNDVFRLFQVVDPEFSLRPPPRIMVDMGEFIDKESEVEINLKALGLKNTSHKTVIDGLSKLYGQS